MDIADYHALRNTPLHELLPIQRQAYAEQVAGWLGHPQAWVRADALERLATAILWQGEPPGMSASRKEQHWREEIGWLTETIEAANVTRPDVLPAFLRIMRFRNPPERFAWIMEEWFDRLEANPPAGLDTDILLGLRILNGEPEDWHAEMPRWVVLLDHRSDWVRACAARRLGGNCDEDTNPSEAELFRLIGEKEVERPGIAGPFWSEMQFASGDKAEQAALWMMDLLERRRGSVPALDDMPSNDIEFYLHELCDQSPEMVDRMLRGGFKALALMTATELNVPVDGMKKRLERLARDADPEIARRAANHLAAHY